MTFSASRIQTWLNCPRKAAWEYICGYKEPGTAATELGDQVHKYLEYLKNTPGAEPDLSTEVGAIAAEAWPFVRDLDAVPEGEFTLRGRHGWIGYKDLRRPGDIWDYKTTSDFKWAKTAEDLRGDVQAVLYAYDEFQRDSSLAEVKEQWLYLRTRKPYQPKLVEQTITREHAELGFEVLEQAADEMQAAAFAAPDDIVARHKYVLNTIPGNEDYCDAYRGCPHRDRCNIPLFREKKEAKNVNILEKMEKLRQEKAQTVTPYRPGAIAPVAGAVVPSPAAQAPVGNMATIAAAVAASAPVATPPAAQGALVGPPHVIAAVVASGSPLATAAALPPPQAGVDYDKNPPPVPATSINPPKRGPGRPRKTNPDAPIALVPTETLTPPPAQLTPVQPEQIPSPAQAAASPPPALSPSVAAASAELAASLNQEHQLEALLVGCFVRGDLGLAVMDFDTIWKRARTIVGDALFFRDYGYKSNGYMLAAVRDVINSDKPAAISVVDPRTPEATLCLSHLRSIAKTAVEAVR